jgi:uncharacterized protein YoxC
MASAGTVTLNLDANSVKLMRELQKAQRTTRTSSRAMAADFQRAFSRIAKASAVAVTAVTGLATAVFRTQSKLIDELAKSSDALGVQTEKLQALRHVGNLTGVSTEALTTNLQRMQRNLGQIVRQGGPAEKALEDIGISIQDIINLSADRQLEEISKAMASVENASLRASIASDLFGRDGARMLKLMEQLKNDGLDPVVAEMNALGASISRIDAGKVERANDEIQKLRVLSSSIAQQFTVGVSTAIATLTNIFIESRKGADSIADSVEELMNRLIIGSINVAASVGQFLEPIKASLEDIWSAFMSLPTWAKEIGIVGAILLGPKGIAAVGLASKALDDTRVTAEWWRAYQDNEIGFFQWLTTGGAKARQELEQMGRDVSTFGRGPATAETGTDFSFITAMFGSTEKQNRDWQAWAANTTNQYVTTFERIKAEIEESSTTVLPITDFIMPDDVVEDVETKLTQMQEFGLQAARNLQNHFAEFLFNPFKDGLRGMAEGFINTLRKMMAEAASAKILGAFMGMLSGSANPLIAGVGAAFGGDRDLGGRGAAGKAYMIGRGAQPEMFIPDSAGTFIPNADKMGGTSFAITIDARDPGAEGRIRTMIEQEMAPQIIEAAQGRTIASMRRPRFA